MRKIADKYSIPFPTILNLNKGNIKKYRNEKIDYPIRRANNKPVSTSLKWRRRIIIDTLFEKVISILRNMFKK